jgi:hypothetical protein
MALYFLTPGGGALLALAKPLWFSASGGGKVGTARPKRLQRGRSTFCSAEL